MVGLYTQLGYETIVTSAADGRGIDRLRDAAGAGASRPFSGQSGVGKSSLLNAIQPGLNLRVREVSDWTAIQPLPPARRARRPRSCPRLGSDELHHPGTRVLLAVAAYGPVQADRRSSVMFPNVIERLVKPVPAVVTAPFDAPAPNRRSLGYAVVTVPLVMAGPCRNGMR